MKSMIDETSISLATMLQYRTLQQAPPTYIVKTNKLPILDAFGYTHKYRPPQRPERERVVNKQQMQKELCDAKQQLADLAQLILENPEAAKLLVEEQAKTVFAARDDPRLDRRRPLERRNDSESSSWRVGHDHEPSWRSSTADTESSRTPWPGRRVEPESKASPDPSPGLRLESVDKNPISQDIWPGRRVEQESKALPAVVETPAPEPHPVPEPEVVQEPAVEEIVPEPQVEAPVEYMVYHEIDFSNFTAEEGVPYLTVYPGDIIYLRGPRNPGSWTFGALKRDPSKAGWFPDDSLSPPMPPAMAPPPQMAALPHSPRSPAPSLWHDGSSGSTKRVAWPSHEDGDSQVVEAEKSAPSHMENTLERSTEGGDSTEPAEVEQEYSGWGYGWSRENAKSWYKEEDKTIYDTAPEGEKTRSDNWYRVQPEEEATQSPIVKPWGDCEKTGDRWGYSDKAADSIWSDDWVYEAGGWVRKTEQVVEKKTVRKVMPQGDGWSKVEVVDVADSAIEEVVNNQEISEVPVPEEVISDVPEIVAEVLAEPVSVEAKKSKKKKKKPVEEEKLNPLPTNIYKNAGVRSATGNQVKIGSSASASASFAQVQHAPQKHTAVQKPPPVAVPEKPVARPMNIMEFVKVPKSKKDFVAPVARESAREIPTLTVWDQRILSSGKASAVPPKAKAGATAPAAVPAKASAPAKTSAPAKASAPAKTAASAKSAAVAPKSAPKAASNVSTAAVHPIAERVSAPAGISAAGSEEKTAFGDLCERHGILTVRPKELFDDDQMWKDCVKEEKKILKKLKEICQLETAVSLDATQKKKVDGKADLIRDIKKLQNDMKDMAKELDVDHRRKMKPAVEPKKTQKPAPKHAKKAVEVMNPLPKPKLAVNPALNAVLGSSVGTASRLAAVAFSAPSKVHGYSTASEPQGVPKSTSTLGDFFPKNGGDEWSTKKKKRNETSIWN